MELAADLPHLTENQLDSLKAAVPATWKPREPVQISAKHDDGAGAAGVAPLAAQLHDRVGGRVVRERVDGLAPLGLAAPGRAQQQGRELARAVLVGQAGGDARAEAVDRVRGELEFHGARPRRRRTRPRVYPPRWRRPGAGMVISPGSASGAGMSGCMVPVNVVITPRYQTATVKV